MAVEANYRDGVLPEGMRRTGPEGLTQEEAERIRAGLPRDDARGETTTGEILRRNLLNYFNLLNLALGACLFLTGSFKNMLFLIAVLANALIGTVQELRARRTMRALRLLNESPVRVVRDGAETLVPEKETVPGDVAVYRAGDPVNADAVVTKGEGAAVESLLTGENDPIRKERGSWLYAGSYVSEGELTAQIVLTGDKSRAGKLIREAKGRKGHTSRLMADIRRLIRLDSAILIPAGALLFLRQYLWGKMPIADAVTSSVAAMVGMIPEGLVLLASVALAAGMVRLGHRKVLVQELDGIESLARSDVLCLDKTGTITKGELVCERVSGADVSDEEAKRELARFAGAFEHGSSTLAALRAYAGAGSEKALETLAFSSARKRSAARFSDETLVLGACGSVLGDACPPDAAREIEALERAGKRVLALVRAEGIPRDGEMPHVLSFLALCVLSDTLRDGIRDTMRYFREQGVTVKVISGDSPVTVSEVAREAGIEGWDAWTDARGIETPADAEKACDRYTVFGRVTPEQKKLLVRALQKKGHFVAMTGDGVNDVPALREAQCSIAMAGGSSAARSAAKVTLLDGDFSRLPDIVLEGRRVVNNITRTASLFLTKTLYSFFLSVLMLFLPGGYPFQPVQLTLVSTLAVGLPGLLLALQPDRSRIEGRFLSTVLRRALPGGFAVAVCAAGAMSLTKTGWSYRECSSLATYVAFAVAYTVLLRTCIPVDRLRLFVLIAVPAAFAAAAALLPGVFGLTALRAAPAPVYLAFAAFGCGLVFAVDVAAKRISAARGKR